MASDSTVVPLRQPDAIDDPLTEVLRSGARRLLAQAVEVEAEAFLATRRDRRLPDGRERVVRHGLGPERLVQTGIGAVPVRRVKPRDRGAGEGGQGCYRSPGVIAPSGGSGGLVTRPDTPPSARHPIPGIAPALVIKNIA